jgi:TonB family protein
MRVRGALLTIAALGLAATPGSAAPRQPSGPWHVDYDTAQCVATRDYGTQAKALALVLKPSPNNSVMRILLIRRGSSEVNQMPALLRFDEFRKSTNMLTYSDEKNHFSVVAINVPMAEFKSHIGARYLSISGGGYDDSFALSDLPSLVAELDKCVFDLQQFWNIGEPYKSRIAKPAEPIQPLSRLFSAGDYPGIALTQRQQGRVTMTFLVGEQGEVADCTVDSTSGIAALDTMSCYVISKRAQFQPALGPNGKPVRSAHTSTVVWRIAP